MDTKDRKITMNGADPNDIIAMGMPIGSKVVEDRVPKPLTCEERIAMALRNAMVANTTLPLPLPDMPEVVKVSTDIPLPEVPEAMKESTDVPIPPIASILEEDAFSSLNGN